MNTKRNDEKQNMIDFLKKGNGDCEVMTNRMQKAKFVDFRTAKEWDGEGLKAVVIKRDKALESNHPEFNQYSVVLSLRFFDTEADYKKSYEDTRWNEYRVALIEA